MLGHTQTDIDEEMQMREEQEILEAYSRRRNELKSRSILRDDSVTLLTTEGQLKVCGCFIVLIVAITGFTASVYAICYVRSPSCLLCDC